MITSNDDSASRVSTIGGAIPLHGNDIDTDRIIPARFLKNIVFDGLGDHVFEDDRAQLIAEGRIHAFDDPNFMRANILVVGSNFGCGSSREHAPQALHRWGIAAVVGVSFAEIFFGNCSAIGIPCVSVSAEEAEQLMSRIAADPRREFELDLEARTLVAFEDEQRSHAYSFAVTMPDGPRQQLMTGRWDTTSELLEGADQIRAAAARLPYINGWTG